LKRIIGEGGWGTVSKACLKDNCNYAVKLIDLPTRNSWKDFKRESELAKRMSKAGLGPKFYDYWHCDHVGFIITDRWDSELSKSAVLSKKQLEKLWQQIEKIHSMGLVHGDLLPNNILVKVNKKNQITDITMSDFGVMDTVNEWKKDVTRLKAFYNYYVEKGLGKYFKDYKIGIKELAENPRHLDYATLYHLSENARRKGKGDFWKSIESKL
jgi:tRNA A-37 threonylcarbamoyl transferase component Bud32